MKVRVDFSVFASPNDAYANVSGELDVLELPIPGDTLSFTGPMFAELSCVSFAGHVSVEARRFDIDGERSCTISLEDIVASGFAEAEELTQYVERSYGLFGYRYALNG